MNIITKLINWLIHKLGGVKKETCEMWEKSAGYWYHKYLTENDRYNTEHENYLAMLNCHNATAEAAQKRVTPVEMAKAIKNYCASRDDCEGCELHNTEHCKLSYGRSCPEYWEVDE